MADKKITALTEGTSLANGDIVPFVDISDTTDAPSGTTKKITKANLVTDLYLALGSSLDADYQPLDAQLTSIAGLTPGAEGRIITSNGLGGYQISAPGDVRSYLNVEDGADVTDATNVDAAGATMNSDTDVSSNSWVIDEDDMNSNSATKVPTQQSVRAYTDNAVSGLTEKINITTTNGTVSGTASETTFLTVTIPANTLGTNGGVIGRFYFEISTASTSSKTLRMKFDGTQIDFTAMTKSGTTGDTIRGSVEYHIYGAGSTDAQEAGFFLYTNDYTQRTSDQVLLRKGTTSKDSTGALDLTFTIDQNSSDTLTMYHAHAFAI